MAKNDPQIAIAQIPPGPWAVGVSGGADSVALLSLLRDRVDLQLTVVHLDHETRQGQSTDDAAFVAELAMLWRLPCVVARRSQIEPALPTPMSNPSALYRACRIELFRRAIAERGLQGVILAHHADDQAETVLHRLIRGSPVTGLGGMRFRSVVNEVTILRPLLGVRRDRLRQVLIDRGQPHREDASNASGDYLRNRLRRWLADRPSVVERLLDMSCQSGGLRDWVADRAPVLSASFFTRELCDLPVLLAREAAKRWLMARGAPGDELPSAVLDRLVEMCTDASTPAKVQFPRNLTVKRRGGRVEAVRSDANPVTQV